MISRKEEWKRQIKELTGSVTGSSIIPILNPTWTCLDLQNAKGWLEVWISGYKLDPRVGGEGREDQNSLELCFHAILSIKITLYSLCLLKAIIMMLEEEEEIQVQKNVFFNSLRDGAWWVLVLKVPNEEAKVLKLLHTLTRKIYFCLPIYMYDLSQVNTPGLLLLHFLCRQSVMHCGFRCAIICTMVYSQVCLKQNKCVFFYIVPCLNKYVI